MTYRPLREREQDSMSIEELCKPISATKMPASAKLLAIGGLGKELSETRARAIQRRVGIDSRKVPREPRVCAFPGCLMEISRQSRSGMCATHLHQDGCHCISCRTKTR